MLTAVRIRGRVDVRRDIQDTLNLLHLKARHNCMVYEDTPQTRGMLQKAKDYIAYGEINKDVLTHLLSKRGRVNGEQLSNAVDQLGYDSVEGVADALLSGDVSTQELRSKGLQVPFRLNAPSKGFNDTRRGVGQGGDLGNHGEKLEQLLKRMI